VNRGVWLAAIWGIGLAVATLFGRRAAARQPRERIGRRHPGPVLRGVLGDLGAVVGTVSTALVLLFALIYVFDHPTVTNLSLNFVTWIQDLRPHGRYLPEVLFPADIALAIIVLPSMLGAAYGGLPRRGTRPNPARLASSLGNGVLIGSAVTAPVAVVGILANRAWLLAAVAVALLLGLVVGLGRWPGTPVDDQAVGSPLSVLHGDRDTVLMSAAVTMFFITPICVVGLTVTAYTLDDAEGQSSYVSPFGELLAAGMLLGLAMAIVVGLGSGSAWLSYSAARSWLALRGRLPWRLMRFLRDAHGRGMLRQVGPAYQFGHALLQDRLARGQAPSRSRRAEKTRPSGRPESRSRRSGLPQRIVLAVMPVLPLAALTCGTIVVYSDIPRPLQIIKTDGNVSVLAMSQEGNELATSTEDGEIDIRNLSTDRVVHAYYPTPVHSGEPHINALTFSPDGGMLIAAMDNGTIAWWNTASGRMITTVKVPELATGGQTEGTEGFSANGQLLASVGLDSNFNNYTMLIEKLSGPDGKPVQVADSKIPGGSQLYNPALTMSSYRNTETVAVTTEDSILVGRFGAHQHDSLSSYQPAQESSQAQALTAQEESQGVTEFPALFSYAALNPDGTVLAAEDGNDAIHIWDVRTGRVEILASPYEKSSGPIAFSPDGRTLAIADAGENGTDVEVWPAPVG
jgi:WD40 repeat protein